MLQSFYCDLHIHIGRDQHHKPVKITGAKSLTLTNILVEASRRKGIQLVGVIDSHVPSVQAEIIQLINDERAVELVDGGIRFENVTLILGSEIEVYDEHCHGPIHVLVFFKTIEKMQQFTHWLKDKMTNIHLSSQRYYGTGKALQYKVKELGGLFIPAHVFTPFKSLYGKGVISSLTEVFDADLIDAIELGLSSDTQMADQIGELHRYTYVTNSDAHSLAKIGREYQEIQMQEPSFKELEWALANINGRKVIRNFGMNPLLGKYYTTVCSECLHPVNKDALLCNTCQNKKIIKGVYDRILELKTSKEPINRPPYQYQVPLEYLPGLGKKTLEKLLSHFGTEMNVIHIVSLEALQQVIPKKLAEQIIELRKGNIAVDAGGGGKYGKLRHDSNKK